MAQGAGCVLSRAWERPCNRCEDAAAHDGLPLNDLCGGTGADVPPGGHLLRGGAAAPASLHSHPCAGGRTAVPCCMHALLPHACSAHCCCRTSRLPDRWGTACEPAVQYADVLYTMGGAANLRAARAYYSAAVDLSSGENVRALYGLCATAAQLGALREGGSSSGGGGKVSRTVLWTLPRIGKLACGYSLLHCVVCASGHV